VGGSSRGDLLRLEVAAGFGGAGGRRRRLYGWSCGPVAVAGQVVWGGGATSCEVVGVGEGGGVVFWAARRRGGCGGSGGQWARVGGVGGVRGA